MNRSNYSAAAALAAILSVSVAGCGAGYLLQASDWGTRLQQVTTKMADVQGITSNPQSLFTNPASQQLALKNIGEVETVLSGIEAEYPDSPPSYHDYLKEGIDELQDALADARTGIEKKDIKKLESFRDKAVAASSKLQTWGSKAQGE